jgi:hypothetical protein
MFKALFFLWRRPDYTQERFMRYYEGQHSHNNQKIRPASLTYRRNYPVWDDPWTDRDVADLRGFDCMTENWYVDRSGWQAVVDAISQGPGLAAIRVDEERFVMRDNRIVFVVDEVLTAPREVAAFPAWADGIERSPFKLLRFVRRQPGQSRAAFKAEYERAAVSQLEPRLHVSGGYTRSYPRFDDPLSITGNYEDPHDGTENDFPYDLIEDFWYASRDAAKADVELLASQTSPYRSRVVVVAEHYTARPPLTAVIPSGVEGQPRSS